jgi:hypothetical protein
MCLHGVTDSFTIDQYGGRRPMRAHWRLTSYKGAIMTARSVVGMCAVMCLLSSPAGAGGKGELQKYFSDVEAKVKATDNPSDKRRILNESFQAMSKALDLVQESPLVSNEDGVAIRRLRVTVQEQQDELAGRNGYVRVTDERLNAFSEYVVQDMEQADQFITISLVTLLLIILLVVLIV